MGSRRKQSHYYNIYTVGIYYKHFLRKVSESIRASFEV